MFQKNQEDEEASRLFTKKTIDLWGQPRASKSDRNYINQMRFQINSGLYASIY